MYLCINVNSTNTFMQRITWIKIAKCHRFSYVNIFSYGELWCLQKLFFTVNVDNLWRRTDAILYINSLEGRFTSVPPSVPSTIFTHYFIQSEFLNFFNINFTIKRNIFNF